MLARAPSRTNAKRERHYATAAKGAGAVYGGCVSGGLRSVIRRFDDRIGRQCEHWAGCVSDHLFRDTPLEQARHKLAPMRAHHDQIGTDFLRERSDLARGIAESHYNYAA
jgi:hypothetical protein